MTVRALVAGASVTGRSVARALTTAGRASEIVVTDADPQRLATLSDLPVTLVPGLDAPPDGTTLVVTSPGWRPEAPLLAAARARGIEVIGDVELAWRLSRQMARDAGEPAADWLAVTGTNGKTTTVGMLQSILRAAGIDAVACGNIGLPVLDAVTQGHRALAVELSSFQLHWSSSVRAFASVVLNVSEDHLDWHGSLDAYAAAKGTIYDGDPVAVFNVDDPASTRLAAGRRRRVGFTVSRPRPGMLGVEDGMLVDAAFGNAQALLPVAAVRPGGDHNVANALAASALARAYGVDAADVAAGLESFRPGSHRAALVAEVGGVGYVDDSKATNPRAAQASLAAYSGVVWIAGGQLKGASVDELVASVADRLSGAVLLGVDREVFAAALARHAPNVPVVSVAAGEDDPMTAAVRRAARMADAGDVVLLAPAAASLDMFADYAQRGEAFVGAVRRLAAGGGDGR